MPQEVGQVDLTLSGLDKLADDELEENGGRVSALATANLSVLADYGVTPAEVAALDAIKARFHSVKSAPRTAFAGRKGETDSLASLVSEQTSLLRNRLDKLMAKFRRAHPESYAGYRSARVMVDRGGSPAPTPAQPTPAPATTPAK